jgi:hypothetical protein
LSFLKTATVAVFETLAGGGNSAVGRKLSPADGGYDGGAFGRRSPCWGHHGEALFLVVGAFRVKTSSFGRAAAAPRRRYPLEGVVLGALSLVVVVELAGGAAGSAEVRVAVGVLRAHGRWKT